MDFIAHTSQLENHSQPNNKLVELLEDLSFEFWLNHFNYFVSLSMFLKVSNPQFLHL